MVSETGRESRRQGEERRRWWQRGSKPQPKSKKRRESSCFHAHTHARCTWGPRGAEKQGNTNKRIHAAEARESAPALTHLCTHNQASRSRGPVCLESIAPINNCTNFRQGHPSANISAQLSYTGITAPRETNRPHDLAVPAYNRNFLARENHRHSTARAG